jgi:DNA-binding transcriptional regulator YiaG
MKKEKIVKQLKYDSLGVPIVIQNAPLKLMLGEWVLDLDLNKLQKDLVNVLIHKPVAMTGAELRFIRKYFEMTTTEFGELLGVSHAAVLKWESDKSQVPPTTEKCIRLYAYDQLKAKNNEFRKFYSELIISKLAKQTKDKRTTKPIKVNADDVRMVA